MNKQGISIGRILTIVGFTLSCFGLLLFLWLAFGGATPLQPKGYRFQAAFPDAATLADQSDVRVAGVTVGKVVAKERDPRGNRTLVTMELETKFAPVRRDARALLRQKTLLGETYVELNLGSREAPVLPEDGRLGDGRIADVVEFDELLRIFDRPTRVAFQDWQQNLAGATRGRAVDLNDALGNLPGFVDEASGVVGTLKRRREALGSLVRNTGVTFAGLTRNEDALQQLINRQTDVFEELADRRDSLAQTFQVFPTFLRESRRTLRRPETFSEDTEPLIRDLEPVLEDVEPTLVSLRRLAPDAQRFFRDLDPLIAAGRTGFPALGDVLRGLDPTLASTGTFLRQLNPILQFIELNQIFLTDFISFGETALAIKPPKPPGFSGADTAGHALAQLVMTGDQSLPSRERSATNRGNAYLGPETFAGSGAAAQKGGFFSLPSFDCRHVGGERRATESTQGCFVQGSYARGLTAYPRVQPAGPGGAGAPLGLERPGDPRAAGG